MYLAVLSIFYFLFSIWVAYVSCVTFRALLVVTKMFGVPRWLSSAFELCNQTASFLIPSATNSFSRFMELLM
jgi:hypothetical protein